MFSHANAVKESPPRQANTTLLQPKPKAQFFSPEETFAPPQYNYNLQSIRILAPGQAAEPPAMPRWPIQAKLEVGAVDDRLEREADEIADKVMRMPEPRVATVSGGDEVVRRKCAECEEEDEAQKKIARKESGGAAALDGTTAPPIVHEVLRSPGQPLDAATREFFEPHFQRELTQVQIHTDLRAAQSAKSVGAQAYTVGQHVVFGDGRYAPTSPEGGRLLAHELTHVLQQEDRQYGIQRAPSVQPTLSPGDVVNRYLIGMHRDYEGLAAELHEHLRKGDYNFVDEAFEHIADGEEDNVAAELVNKLSRVGLDKIASSSEGRHTLTILYEAMITGNVSDFEREQAARIVDAKLRQMRPEDFVASEKKNPRGGKTLIFPVRFMRVTPGYDDAPLKAELTPDGMVRASYTHRVKHTPMFADEFRTLPDDAFLDGVVLNPNEIVGIRDYESDGKTRYTMAVELIDYSNQAKRSTLGKIATVAVTVGTLGVGTAVEGAAAAGTWAARLALVDEFVNVIQVVTFFVGENRDWLVENLGWPGRLLVRTSEIADSAIAIYGVARLGHAGIGLLKDVRTAAKACREESKTLSNATPKQVGDLEKMEADSTKLLEEMEGAEREAHAPKQTEGEPEEMPKEAKQEEAEAERNERAVAGKEVPGLTGCSFGSLFCPTSYLRDEFRELFARREQMEFYGYIREGEDVDLNLARSLRRDMEIATGDAMYRQYLEEVPRNQWTEPFREAVDRGRRAGVDFRPINAGGGEYRWPLDDYRAPWTVHHDPPLLWVPAESSAWWHPMPYRLHLDAHAWWQQLENSVRRRIPKDMRELIHLEDIDFRDL